MRIAMFSWESMHSIAIGGLAPHVTELAGGLQRLGHDVHVFTRMGIGQSRYDVADGVHYHRCPFEPHADFLTYIGRMCDSFAWHFAETEAYLGKRFDVVHGHDWMTTWTLSQIKQRTGHPTVFTMHSTEFGRCGNSLWDDPMSRRIRDIEWEGTFVAHRVICVSKTLAEETKGQYAVPADKITPIYNGVNVEKYDGKVDSAAVRKFHGIGLDDPMVLFAGRLTWQKGPDLLVEAIPGVLKSHPRTKILFAGDGDMKAGLETRATQVGINHATRFLGHCKGEGLVNLFKSSDLVCVPSRNEPFGIVILEAWSAGKPVVATRIGGPTEFVQHAVNGYTVDPGIETIGQGLELMLADMPSAREMGRKGRIEAESRFTWDHSAAATERVYQSILNGQAADTSQANGGHRKENGNMSRHNTPTTKPAEGGIATKSMPAKDVVNGPNDAQIRERAYQIYLTRSRTGTPGDSTTDWLQAERELRSANTGATTAGRRGK